MRILTLIVLFAVLVQAAAMSATADPLASMHYLVGTWNCTYHAGSMRFDYVNTYTYDQDGRALRQVASWTGGSDEELIAYDAQHKGWTAVVLDSQGNATAMRAAGSDPNHIPFRSVYPDDSIATTFDRVSTTEYTLHATVRSGGKTITSVDTCMRGRQ